MCNESSDSEDSEDSKYPSLNESKACSRKVMDKRIHCDICTEWFHLICLSENVDPEDNFVCENCC